ncbi:hypothetical protein GL263_19530 [Streptomyces durbertensis]|uniref:Lipoprotein n=1 Tax=Streptomyces durbertensis TaxID=2448886 RepID=A0ABR6EK70_9ACTN|nr:hypothetical protein [Streptomyces durbertensis]MBB1245733.1 hypothetical protein [Streptomyces durbertensis]
MVKPARAGAHNGSRAFPRHTPSGTHPPASALRHPKEPEIKSFRPLARTAVALTSATLLLTVATACSTADHLTSAMRVKNAVAKLGEQESVSVTARFDATPAEILAYLQEGNGPGKGPHARQHARLLADLEIAAALSAGKPLRDVNARDRVDNAAAVNFGGKDVFAFKSVDSKLYTRVNLAALATELEESATPGEAGDTAGEDEDTAGEGPASLSEPGELQKLLDAVPDHLTSAKAALGGRWVRVSPDEFGRINEALGGEAGTGSDRLAQATALLREPALQQRVVTAVENALGKRARFTGTGRREGADHVTLTLNARDAARELGRALAPVRAQLGDPDLGVLDAAPDRKISMDLAIRHERLSTLTVDLGQFDEGRSGALPLKLTFAAGEVVSVAAPAKADRLDPRDLLDALSQVAVRHPELSRLR